MSRVSQLVMQLSYVAGLISLALAVLLVFAPGVTGRIHLTPRGGLVFAGTLFLCAIASYVFTKAGDKS